MNINRAAIKLNAKNQMQAAKPHVCVVGLIYYVIAWVLSYLSQRVMGTDPLRVMYSLSDMQYVYSYAVSAISAWGSLLSLALSIVSSTMAVGFTIYALRVCRIQKADIGTLFDGFAIFFRALWLTILIGIFTFLWSLLLIVPGIIAAYRYRQAYYLLIDNPQMSALDCIRESKRMMIGRKWELFVLDLSFLGWALLCIVPFVAIWVTPYTEVTYANYYTALLGLPGSNGAQNGGYNGGPGSGNSDGKPPWEL